MVMIVIRLAVVVFVSVYLPSRVRVPPLWSETVPGLGTGDCHLSRRHSTSRPRVSSILPALEDSARTLRSASKPLCAPDGPKKGPRRRPPAPLSSHLRQIGVRPVPPDRAPRVPIRYKRIETGWQKGQTRPSSAPPDVPVTFLFSGARHASPYARMRPVVSHLSI